MTGQHPKGYPLARCFAACELKGDWHWFLDLFELRDYWKTRKICFKCHARKTLTRSVGESRDAVNPSMLYTNFGGDFGRRNTVEFIQHCLPLAPVPLILLQGFHVCWLRWCIMHALNLGIYQILAAEGLLFLAEKSVSEHGGSIAVCLKSLYNDFRRFCTRAGVHCSTRAWKLKDFHLGKDPASPTEHPWINLKAYNCRCVLAWLAVSLLNRALFFFFLDSSDHFVFEICR